MPNIGRARMRTARGGLALTAVAFSILAIGVGSGVASFHTGTYAGSSNQGGRILSLTATKKNVHLTYFDYQDSCDNGTFANGSYAGLDAKIKKNGKFTIKGPGTTGFVKGKFKGKKASGTAFHGLRGENGVYCSTGPDVTWTAKKG